VASAGIDLCPGRSRPGARQAPANHPSPSVPVGLGWPRQARDSATDAGPAPAPRDPMALPPGSLEPPFSASTTRGCANASASASTGARCPVLCGCDRSPLLPARHRVPAKDASSVKGGRGGAPRPTNVVGTSGTSRHGPVGVTAPKRKSWVSSQASPVGQVLEKEFSRATPLTEAGVGRGLDG
jgi:hypothetical protein